MFIKHQGFFDADLVWVLKAFGFSEKSEPFSSPGTREHYGDGVTLTKTGQTHYGSVATTMAYLAVDRCGLQYLVYSGTVHRLTAAKRMARCLLRRPRIVQRFVPQEQPARLRVMSGSDHGGCKVRRFMSAACVFHGNTYLMVQVQVRLSLH
eukprot:5063218-Amphidinium_carterae.2